MMKFAWLLMLSALAIVFTGAASPEVAETSPSPAPSKSEAPLAASPPVNSSGCLVDEASIEDLKKRRTELDAEAKELQARDTEIKSKERALEEELKKLTDVRDEIAKLGEAGRKDNEEKVGKLVETFETMSPKSAAQVLSSIDETLAVTAMSRISTARLAKIMNIMDPAKSSKLSELLAGVVHAKTATNQKGGEHDDANHHVGPKPAGSIDPSQPIVHREESQKQKGN